MKKAILATKVGMTQIFNADGVLTPVTVLQAGPCVVTQIKTVENDGYEAVQVGFADKREKLVSKPEKGHFDKAGVSYKRYVREFKFENAADYKVADEIKKQVGDPSEAIVEETIAETQLTDTLQQEGGTVVETPTENENTETPGAEAEVEEQTETSSAENNAAEGGNEGDSGEGSRGLWCGTSGKRL